MARAPGSGRIPDSKYIVKTTPDGGRYYVDRNKPDVGYLVNPEDTLGAIGYPIEYINWMLRPTPPTAGDVRPAATGQAREIGGAALGGKIGIGYGQTRIAPSIMFGPRSLGGYDNQVAVGYGLSQGPCDSLIDIIFPTPYITLTLALAYGAFSYNFRSGSLAGSGESSILRNAAGGTAGTFEQYPGLTYVDALLTQHQLWQSYPGAFPMPLFLGRWRVVRNYATGLDAWTDNPAYCLADYITSARYGQGAKINASSAADAAAYCDGTFLNAATGLYEKRHTLNYFLLRAADHRSHINALRAHFRCTVIERGGEFVFLIDKDSSPVATFSEQEAVPVSMERMGGSGIPNAVIVNSPDSNNNYEMAPQFARTAGVEAGTAVLKLATYELEGINNQVHQANEAFYLLNTRLNNLRVVLRAVHQKARKLEPNDVIEYTTASFGLTSFRLRVLRNTRSADGTAWMLECAGHDPNVYTFQSRAVETYPLPVLPNPYATPPTPAVPTLTQEGFNVRIDFVPPAGYAYYAGQRITVQQSGGFSEYVLGEAASGPLYIKGVTMGSTYTVRAKVISTIAGLLSAAASAQITPAMAQIPPDVAISASVSYVSAALPTGAASISFPKPFVPTNTLYGAGALTATNLQAYTAANVNDGALGAAAFNWNVAGASRLAFNLGSAKTIGYIWIYTSAFAGDPIIETSDDGITWSGGATSLPVGYVADVGGGIALRVYAAPGGSHQYVAITKASTTAEATTFYEVWPRDVTTTVATANDIVRYNVYGVDGGASIYSTRRFYGSIDFGAEPTPTTPFDVNAIAYHDPASWPPAFGITGASRRISVYVTTVSPGGVESPGLFMTQGGFFAATGVALPIDQIFTQGADIASAATTDIGAATGWEINITGTTTITSLGTKTAGVVRMVTFTSALVLTHNATSLILPGAANITTAAGDAAIFESLGSGNWKCFSYVRATVPPWGGGAGELTSGTLAQARIPILIDQNADSGGILVDSAGLKRFGIMKDSGKNSQFRYDASIALDIVRITAGTIPSPTAFDVPFSARTDGGVDFAGGKVRVDSGGRIVQTGGGTPAVVFVVNGFGAGATVSLDAGGRDGGGTITITAGTAAGSAGSVRVTFASALGTNTPLVSLELIDASGGWDNRAVKRLVNGTPTTAKFEAFFDNNSINFTNGSTYKFNYRVTGN